MGSGVCHFSSGPGRSDVLWLKTVRALLASVQSFTGGRCIVLVAMVWSGHFLSGRFEGLILGVCRGCHVTQLKWTPFMCSRQDLGTNRGHGCHRADIGEGLAGDSAQDSGSASARGRGPSRVRCGAGGVCVGGGARQKPHSGAGGPHRPCWSGAHVGTRGA